MQLSRDFLVLNRYFREKRAELLEPYGLKGYHARFLIEISHAPGISQDGLSQKLGLDKSNVARQAAFLEESGYLNRESAPTDKRVLCLYPTEKALELLEPFKEKTLQWEQALLQALSQEEQTRLMELLEKLRAAVERKEV